MFHCCGVGNSEAALNDIDFGHLADRTLFCRRVQYRAVWNSRTRLVGSASVQ